jgi:hypothetical protein
MELEEIEGIPSGCQHRTNGTNITNNPVLPM